MDFTVYKAIDFHLRVIRPLVRRADVSRSHGAALTVDAVPSDGLRETWRCAVDSPDLSQNGEHVAVNAVHPVVSRDLVNRTVALDVPAFRVHTSVWQLVVSDPFRVR